MDDKLTEAMLVQLTAFIEKLPQIIESLWDNPIALIILLAVASPVLKFGWNILSFVFDCIMGFFHIVYQIIISPLTLTRFVLQLRRHRSKKPEYDEEFGQKYGYEDEGEYQRIEFGEPPTTHKKSKPTSPDQDLAASLKTNLLDE